MKNIKSYRRNMLRFTGEMFRFTREIYVQIYMRNMLRFTEEIYGYQFLGEICTDYAGEICS